MRFGSLFAGIGGFDLGLERAGMECAWQVEIDPFCSELLADKWPQIVNHGDIRNVGKGTEAVELISGGFPCQDLSVAGKRAGLAGKRSGLWGEFARVLEELCPRWIIIENVPGLLSSNEGGDMGILTGKLAQLGYWWASRVLDAQYLGVAQRRCRVFIVGNLAEPTYPAKVLFEPESCERHTPPRREEGQVASTLFASGAGTSRPAGTASETGFLIPEKANIQTKRRDGIGSDHETLIVFSGGQSERAGSVAPSKTTAPTLKGANSGSNQVPVLAFHNRQDPDISGEVTHPLGSQDNGMAIAWRENKAGQISFDSKAKALRSGASHNYQGIGVRRLTPLECERLQGFPDGWTEGFSDTQRYKMLGNAVAVPCAEWIARRIMQVEANEL